MNTAPEYKIDRTAWPRGEWDSEPDRLDFVHSNLACLLLRNRAGAWCGYVGVPETHPAFGKDYDSVDVDVHGGLTYAAECRGFICHVPESGMPDNVWWLGFDTAHSGDRYPGMLQYGLRFGFGEYYKNMGYARQQTERLAEQLAASTIKVPSRGNHAPTV